MRKPIQIVGLLLFAGLFLFSYCSSSKANDNGIKRLTNQQFRKEAAKPNTVVLDVRTPEEFKEGHIEGAMMINYLDTVNFTKKVLTLDPSKHYLLYCRSGRRSLDAANIMKDKGFKNVSDLKDGISGWDGPTVTEK